jgi:uncharacterized protein YqeY
MLIDTLKKDNMLALKDHNTSKRAILSIVINKWMVASTDAKVKAAGGVSEADIISMIQKTIKEVEEEKLDYEKVNNSIKSKDCDYQIEVLQSYLPKMLSKEEIKSIIDTLEDKSVPAVMKHFKTNYAGKVDMGLVLQVTKEINA